MEIWTSNSNVTRLQSSEFETDNPYRECDLLLQEKKRTISSSHEQ